MFLWLCKGTVSRAFLLLLCNKFTLPGPLIHKKTIAIISNEKCKKISHTFTSTKCVLWAFWNCNKKIYKRFTEIWQWVRQSFSEEMTPRYESQLKDWLIHSDEIEWFTAKGLNHSKIEEWLIRNEDFQSFTEKRLNHWLLKDWLIHSYGLNHSQQR